MIHELNAASPPSLRPAGGVLSAATGVRGPMCCAQHFRGAPVQSPHQHQRQPDTAEAAGSAGAGACGAASGGSENTIEELFEDEKLYNIVNYHKMFLLQ